MKHLKVIVPLYIVFSWFLIAAFVLFTEAVVETLFHPLTVDYPLESQFLVSTITLVNIFAGLFVLTSAIPSLMLKGRSILLQFLMIVPLVVVIELLRTYGDKLAFFPYVDLIVRQNPIIAAIHFVAPYIFLLYLHFQSKKHGIEIQNAHTGLQ